MKTFSDVYAVMSILNQFQIPNEYIMWQTRDNEIQCHVILSHTSYPGGTDTEEITAEDIPKLKEAIEDMVAIEPYMSLLGPELFVARKWKDIYLPGLISWFTAGNSFPLHDSHKKAIKLFEDAILKLTNDQIDMAIAKKSAKLLSDKIENDVIKEIWENL